MNRNMIISGRFFFPVLVAFGLVAAGCNRTPKTGGEGSGEFQAAGTIDEETQEQLNTAKRIFYSLPSPLETAMLIKNAGAVYNEELLNPTGNTSMYITYCK